MIIKYNRNRVDLDTQITVFIAQIILANKFKKPLVIHCRGMEERALEIMAKNIESKSHPIHLHCFTGGWEIAKRYLSTFSNLCIGVTPLLASNVYHNPMKELIANMPLNKLLLETDSPYFVPRTPDVCF